MAHYNLKWTDEKLGSTIREVRLKHGKVTPALLIEEGRGAYDHLWRRVKKGDFQSVAEAIEKISLLVPVSTSVDRRLSVTSDRVQQTEGRPLNLKLADEEIMKHLVGTFLSRGRLTVGNRDIYADLRRRVQRGKFISVKEAMERLWFRGLAVANSDFVDRNCLLWWAAKWLVDTTNNGNAKSVKRLNRLIEWEEGKVREVLKEIFRPCYPAAQSIVRGFAVSRRGKKLRGLMSTMRISVMN